MIMDPRGSFDNESLREAWRSMAAMSAPLAFRRLSFAGTPGGGTAAGGGTRAGQRVREELTR